MGNNNVTIAWTRSAGMPRLRRIGVAGLLGLALLGSLISRPAAAEEQLLRRGNDAEPESLDPAKAESSQTSNILNDLFEPLVTLDAADRPVPAAAASWEISTDGLTYLFHLRPGLQWSDGTPLTAEDFAYAIRRVVDPATAALYASLAYPIKNAQAIAEGRLRDLGLLGVTAVDATTLRMTLVRPTPYWVALMSDAKFLPVKRSVVEKFGAAFTQPGKLVSNGAFMLQDWTPQSRIVVVKNPHFHDAASVHVDKVIFYPIESEVEEFNRYRAGELDVTYHLPSQQMDLIRQNMASDLRSEASLTLDYLGFNLSRPPFADNPKLREALSMAIDRQTLVDKIVKTGAPIAFSAVPAVGLPDYVDQPSEWAWLPMPEKIAKAQKLYREAGYSADHPLEVELRIVNSDNVRKIAIAVIGMWKSALGVKTSLVAEEFKTLVEHRHHRGELQLFWYSWIADYPDATSFLDLFTSRSLDNDFGYRNPAYDQLVAEAEQTADIDRRNSMLERAEQMLIGENPVIPLYVRVQPYLVKPWVKGFHIDPVGYTYDKDVTILPH